MIDVATSFAQKSAGRLDLYRLLSDAGRVQLLALCQEEELSVGELAQLLGESQPQISRRATSLRKAGLLQQRRDGTRIYLKTCAGIETDVVVNDALAYGRQLCQQDQIFSRLAMVLLEREAPGLQYFENHSKESQELRPVQNDLGQAHLVPLSGLLPGRELAIDVGCGDGALLELLAPLFSRVIAVDRSPSQLAKTAARIQNRGYANVSLFEGNFDDTTLRERVDPVGGADLIYCSRVLHHAPRPTQALNSMRRLLKPNGHLIVVDYLTHQDETMRQQGDIWLGFSPDDLKSRMQSAGLDFIGQAEIPTSFSSQGSQEQLPWQFIIGRNLSSTHPTM
jgi:SAM-dependent methyltransferase